MTMNSPTQNFTQTNCLQISGQTNILHPLVHSQLRFT